MWGAYQARRGIDASDRFLVVSTSNPSQFDVRMLLNSSLLFVLVPFVYAQLVVQDNTELESEMTSATDTGIDHPGHVPLDVENYPVAPSTLQLEQVYLFIRHGALGRSFVCLPPQSFFR